MSNTASVKTHSLKTRSILTPEQEAKRHHREVLTSMSGIFVAMFAVLSAGTMISTSMPVIIADIKGSQIDYTWIVTSSLLTMAVSTPIWAKLGDFLNRKTLLQIVLVIFTLSSLAAGFAQNSTELLTARAFSGISMGGLMSLGQVIMADLVSARERGKFSGYMGGILLTSQLGSPLLGGWITDTWGSEGWRWNFWVMAPIVVVALVILQLNLHLPRHPSKVKIDYLGAVLIALGIGGILIWISLGGKDSSTGGFAWTDPASFLIGGVSIALTIAAIFWELFGSKEPLVPLRLFGQKTFTFATLGSIPIGIAQFGAAVFLGQYMQLARGYSPTESGLMTFPMVIGTLLASVLIGQIVSRTGVWKPYVITGAILFTAGAGLLATIHYNSNMWLVGLYMGLLGLGMGAVMQNMVLVAQNSLPVQKLSSGSGALTFLRTLGGAAGVTVLGASLANTLPSSITTGMKGIGIDQEALQRLAGSSSTAGANVDPEALKPLLQLIDNGNLKSLADATTADPKVLDGLQALTSLSQGGASGTGDPSQLQQLLDLIATNPNQASQLLPNVDIQSLEPLANAVHSNPDILQSISSLSSLGTGSSSVGGTDPSQLQNLLSVVHDGSLNQFAHLMVNNPDCFSSLSDISGGGSLPQMSEICEPIRNVLESSYGDGISMLFLPVAIIAIVTIICTIFIPNKPLSHKTAVEQIEEELGGQFDVPQDDGFEGGEPVMAEVSETNTTKVVNRTKTKTLKSGVKSLDDNKSD